MQVQIRHLVLSLGLSCGLPFCSALAQESEKPVRMRDLPAAVQATVREQRKGAVLLGLAQETENGQTSYEAEWRVNGHNKDVLMDAAGKVVVVEEHVNFAALPPVVQTGLRKLAGRGRIVLIESHHQRR
jgi:hypothetical protein